MNITPNEDKMNLPIVTPLNLIGDIMSCKDCRFVRDRIDPIAGLVIFCVVDHESPKSIDPEKTACWKFKLKTVDKPIKQPDEMKCKDCNSIATGTVNESGRPTPICNVDPKDPKETDLEKTACWKFKLPEGKKAIVLTPLPPNDNKLLDEALKEVKEISKQEDDPRLSQESIAGDTVRKELGNIAEKTIHPMATDKPQLETIQAVIGDAVEVHFKGLHRVEYMVKLPNGVGAAVLTGPDGISRLLTQNECYFVKRIKKEGEKNG